MKKPALNLLYFLVITMDLILKDFRDSNRKDFKEIRKEFQDVASKSRKIVNDLNSSITKDDRGKLRMLSKLLMRTIDVILASSNNGELDDFIKELEKREEKYKIKQNYENLSI